MLIFKSDVTDTWFINTGAWHGHLGRNPKRIWIHKVEQTQTRTIATMTIRKRELDSAVHDPLSDEQHETQDKQVINDIEACNEALNDVNHATHVKALGRLVRQVALSANSVGTPYMKVEPDYIATVLQSENERNTVQQAWQEKSSRLSE